MTVLQPCKDGLQHVFPGTLARLRTQGSQQLHAGNLLTKDCKKVIKRSELYNVLVQAHQRTAHRGRQITSKWINENYSEVNVKVVNLNRHTQKA